MYKLQVRFRISTKYCPQRQVFFCHFHFHFKCLNAVSGLRKWSESGKISKRCYPCATRHRHHLFMQNRKHRRDESKPGAVQPSLDATRSAYEQGETPGDKTGPVLCWVKLISLKRLYLGHCLPVTHLLSICFF